MSICTGVADTGSGQADCHRHNVYAVSDRKDAGEATAIHRRVDELQAALTQATKGIVALAVGLENSGIIQPGSVVSANPVRGVAGRHPSPGMAGTQGTSWISPHTGVWGLGNAGACSPKTDPCQNCGHLCHWERHCTRERKPTSAGAGVKLVSSPHTTSAQIVLPLRWAVNPLVVF